MIYKISQSLNMPIREVIYGWSFENLMLLMAAAPNLGSKAKKEEEGKEWDERLDANNPDNFTINQNSSSEDEEYVF